MRLIQWSTTRIHLLLTSIILFECTILIVNNIRQSCFENSKIISKNGEEPTNLKPKYHIPPLKTRLHLPVLLYDLNVSLNEKYFKMQNNAKFSYKPVSNLASKRVISHYIYYKTGRTVNATI